MNYHHYTTIDFATDDEFIRWVLSADPHTDRAWQKWIQEHPHQAEDIARARALILSVNPKETDWPEDRQMAIKARIMAQTTLTPQQASTYRNYFLRNIGKIAACIGFIIIAMSAWVIWKSRPLHFQTGYGATKEVQLPDGSKVILNANSSLVYHRNFWTGERNAELSGEAFFQVQKTRDSAHFTVKSSNILTEVLGTEFNIRTRRDTTQVVLATGSIRLHVQENQGDQGLTLSPGELIEYAQRDVIRKEQVDTKLYAGLRDHVLIFNKTPLRVVATQVFDLYGYTLHFPDGMEDESFTAQLPLTMDGIELLSSLLSESFRLRVSSKKDSVLTFKKSP